MVYINECILKTIPWNIWVVHIRSISSQEISYTGKPQVVSRYILSNIWELSNQFISSLCHFLFRYWQNSNPRFQEGESSVLPLCYHFLQTQLRLRCLLWNQSFYVDLLRWYEVIPNTDEPKQKQQGAEKSALGGVGSSSWGMMHLRYLIILINTLY
jgi:hypothetical protein